MSEDEPSQTKSPRIALTLSGGGLRATLFHLGVIRYLSATGLLSSVKVITSVSGGSIAAAHLIKNWSSYNGTLQDFDKIASKIRALASLDIRGRIVRRLLPLLPGAFLARATRLRPLIPRTSTELLEQYYKKKLYGSTRLSDLDGDELPLLFTVTTNLTRGEASAFWRGGIFNVPIDGETPESVHAPGIQLATAVAASSAYPGLFPPLELTWSQIAAQKNEFESEGFADGGVTDNLGTFVLDKVIEKIPLQINTIIVSDAGRSYVGIDHGEPNFVWTALRSTDLMMYRIREQQLQQMENLSKLRPALIAISDSSDADDSSSRAIEKRLQEVRTDLDFFPPVLVQELERHGFFIAEKVLQHVVPTEWRPTGKATDGDRLEQKILDAAHRNFWPFSARDWLSYVYLVGVLIFIGFSVKAAQLMKPKVELAASFLKMSGDSPSWVRPPNAQTERDAITEIDCAPSSDVSLVEQQRIWDLRRLIRYKGSKDILGPALLTRSLTVMREPTGAGFFRFTFQTSGNSTAVWIRDGKYPARLYRAKGQGLNQVGDSQVQPWCVEVDLSALEIGKKAGFSVQTEVFNAFRSRENWWIGLRNDPPTSLASMRIIFPRALPFKNARFSSQPNDLNLQATDLDGVEVRQRESEILWAVSKPREKWTYRVDWDWTEESKAQVTGRPR